MAKVEIMLDHPLPAVCIICGNQASSFVAHSFHLNEASEFAVNVVIEFVLNLIFGGSRVCTNSNWRDWTRVDLNVPFCGRHSNYFGSWGRGTKHLLRLFGIVMIPLAAWEGITEWLPQYAIGIESAMMVLAALVLVWLVVTLYIEFSSLRITKRAESSFVLHNVSPAFVETCGRAG